MNALGHFEMPVGGEGAAKALPGEAVLCPRACAPSHSGANHRHSTGDASHLPLDPLTQFLSGQITRSPSQGKGSGRPRGIEG